MILWVSEATFCSNRLICTYYRLSEFIYIVSEFIYMQVFQIGLFAETGLDKFFDGYKDPSIWSTIISSNKALFLQVYATYFVIYSY